MNNTQNAEEFAAFLDGSIRLLKKLRQPVLPYLTKHEISQFRTEIKIAVFNATFKAEQLNNTRHDKEAKK